MSADNVALPAVAAACHAAVQLLLSAVQQSINISCMPCPQQRTATGEWDRQTDGQTQMDGCHTVT